MLAQEVAIGNYTSKEMLDDFTRKQVVLLIEDLYLCKQYDIETLFLAVNLMDRYL